MKKFISVLFVSLLLFSQLPSKKQLEAIKESTLKSELTFLASDEFKGRDTGSPELDIAARYLATKLESYGYKGLAKNNSFFQEVPLISKKFKNEAAKITYDEKDISFRYGKELVFYSWGKKAIDIKAPLVSVGSGLYTEKHKDYKKKDVEGKIAIRFDLAPSFDKLVKNNQKYIHQNIRNTLFKNGAKAVIYVIPNKKKADSLITLYKKYSGESQMALKGIKKDAKDNPRTYIIMTMDMYKTIASLDEKSSPTKAGVIFSHPMHITIELDTSNIITKNVVGYIEGSDSMLKKEFVGYGAHYDHIGVDSKGQIYNGADDDGSGTIGILNIAKAVAMKPPKRSVFFIFHTAEEKGLLGSYYFSEHPLIPLDKIVSVLNLDMIGSNHEIDKVYVIGADRISKELDEVNIMANEKTVKLDLDYKYNVKGHPERLYFRSDHYNYARKGIPIIFYTNDNPNDYHKPSDTVEKINFKKMARISRLAFATGYYVANMEKRLKINPDSKKDEE